MLLVCSDLGCVLATSLQMMLLLSFKRFLYSLLGKICAALLIIVTIPNNFTFSMSVLFAGLVVVLWFLYRIIEWPGLEETLKIS